MLIIAGTLGGGTWLLFESYSWKHRGGSEGQGNVKEQMCDIIFSVDLAVLAYIYGRVTESYREVNRVEEETKMGRPRRRVECPRWYIYCFYLGALVVRKLWINGIFLFKTILIIYQGFFDQN